MQIKTETRVGIFVIIALCLFFYMTIFLGVFRLDRGSYNLYTVFFDDISGLEKKAVVKIAGVNVGWVDKIELIYNDPYKAKAYLMVRKNYVLHTDAYAVVRQEGLLGGKYLEVVPGDPMLPELPANHALTRPGKAPASIDQILHKVQEIATHVEDVTQGFKDSFGGPAGRDSLQEIIKHFSRTAESIAAFSERLDRTFSYNEGNINSMLADLREFARDMKESVPSWGNDLQRLSNKIELEFIPALQSNVDRIARVFDADVSGLAQQAEESFKSIRAVAGKIDEGQGLLGKLINDDETYYDIKDSIGSLKNYFAKMENLSIVVDAHGEYMYRPAERVPWEDTKGYLDVRIHPSEDHFYIFQLVGSQKGNIKRRSLIKNWYDERGELILPSQFIAPANQSCENRCFLPELIGRIDTLERNEDSYKYGLQVGKIFKDVCFRFGMFENAVGVAVDVDIPFQTDKFRWVTSLEGFDFRGRDRIDDDRPHLKWINRVFILRNIYASFGADDFISRNNANAFFGFGLRFCDDDLKYLATKVGFLGQS